ncbi:MAG: 1-acyl-sn-glycerol-3-phosphate acyltransferase [Oscillospiraceae bacterium]|nr:1-acyl-sn-glycerol-3-phosphate acyltransferase [Oscillospiraceae bacterium]
MKIDIKHKSYDEVQALPRPKRKTPKKVGLFWRCLIRLLTIFGMMGTRFKFESQGLEKLKKEPCLILMNHSCFLDMQIAYRILFPKHFCIVSTTDSFVGFGGLMGWLMRTIGCIPTQKFVTDLNLIQDMNYAFKTLKTSVLMYPEAGYSLDGTATSLPRKMGVLLKKFDVPVIMIESFGAFSRNPLYNELQVRKKVQVTAKARCLFTWEQIHEKTVRELSDELDAAFGFDHFKWQAEQGLEITEPFRADGLHRILYQCPHCGAEGQMEGKGIHLTCGSCGKRYELTPLGHLKALTGETEFSHIPDWFRWQRQQVRQQILEGSYRMEADVKIGMLIDYKALYMVGEGKLIHDLNGITLTGCDGKLTYTHKPLNSYNLNADYYWYEIGDIISIGDKDGLFYCFPKDATSVAKARLATEEMYKLYKSRQLTVPV